MGCGLGSLSLEVVIILYTRTPFLPYPHQGCHRRTWIPGAFAAISDHAQSLAEQQTVATYRPFTYHFA